jgi:structure-specific recognition protein 1
MIVFYYKDEEIECDLALSEPQIEKYGDKLEKSYDAPTYQVISEVFAGLSGKRVMRSKFKSSTSSQGIKCSLKANEALLYPLERHILSVPKPPTLLSHREITRVTFSRVGGLKTFEVKFSMDSGVEHSYSSIPREEFVYLEDYCRAAEMNVENEMEGDGRAFADDVDMSDDEEAGRGARRGKEVNFGGDTHEEDETSSGESQVLIG